jgi:hypothetical protein
VIKRRERLEASIKDGSVSELVLHAFHDDWGRWRWEVEVNWCAKEVKKQRRLEYKVVEIGWSV